MKMLPPIVRAAPAALVLMLAGCNSAPETPTAANAVETNVAEATAAPVELPPSLMATRTFRCKDNSLVYIDFYSGEKTADLRAEKEGAVTKLTAAEAGKPLEGGGWSVSGTGKEVSITRPGKGAQSCKA